MPANGLRSGPWATLRGPGARPSRGARFITPRPDNAVAQEGVKCHALARARQDGSSLPNGRDRRAGHGLALLALLGRATGFWRAFTLRARGAAPSSAPASAASVTA